MPNSIFPKKTKVVMNKLLLMLMFISLIIFGNCNLLDRDDSSVIRWKGEDLSEYVLYAFPVDKVAIINLETGDVIKILDDFDEHIKSLITNKDGSTIYVSTADGPAGTNPGNIYRIDTETWIREVIYENAAYLLERKYDEIFFVSRTQAYHERVLGKLMIIPVRFQ